MGGVCPCLAGVDKAAADAKAKAALPASSAPKAPLLEPKTIAPPVQQAAVKVEPAAPAVTAEPAAPEVGLPYAADSGAQAQGAAAGNRNWEIGSCLEVYSNSYKAWCPGIVYALDTDAIFLAYQVPGEPADANISTKTLPMDSEELRDPVDSGSNEQGAWMTASVEVYSHSNKAWCLGKVTEITGGVASVVFFYPNEPPDAIPVMKQLPLCDKDLRLRGIDAAFQQPGAGLGHDTLEVNSSVEVYSNSLGVWCPGVVQELKEGFATISFFYPDMDPSTEQPAVKELPLGHQDLRVLGYGGNTWTGPPLTEAELKPDMEIEVFSQSRQVWIVSTVKEIANGEVTVQLRYPDMPPDSDLYEKVLPIGCQDMRLIVTDK